MSTPGRLPCRTPSRGRPRPRRVGCCLAILLLAASGPAAAQDRAADPAAPRPSVELAQAADPLVVQDIQFLLSDLGWELGAADGILGDRTRLAILEAQQRYGYTPADGAPSAALRDFLETLGTAAPTAPVPAAPVAVVPAAPVAAAPAAPPPDDETEETEAIDRMAAILVGSRWTIADSTGAMLTLVLQADGSVAGPTAGDRWTWSTAGDTISLSYESGIGDWARREGVVVDRDSMQGAGESSLGTTWTWTARRLP